MKSADVRKLKSWLKLQAKAVRAESFYLEDDKFRVSHVAIITDGVHLNSENFREIARILGCTVVITQFSPAYSDHFYMSFEYDGMRYYAVRTIREEYHGR